MRRHLLAAALAVSMAAGAAASDVVVYESITVSTTAVAISASTLRPDGKLPIEQCRFRLEGAQIRERHDGTAPTATEGVIVEVGDVIAIDNARDAGNIKFIRTGGTDGTLKGHCWR